VEWYTFEQVVIVKTTDFECGKDCDIMTDSKILHPYTKL
jgi:hypothetical protein